MKRHLRTAFGLSVSASALTIAAVVILGQAATERARNLWPADDSTFIVDGWDVGAA